MEKDVLNAMKEAGKPVRPGEIAKALDVDSKDVSKAIKTLKEKGEVISPKRCYYSLP
ncbi:MAG: MarR family transcriptional regulator [Desulfobacterales bacterium]|nr:MarR family transcriptional regulator [Desulfobacterales bacterium]